MACLLASARLIAHALPLSCACGFGGRQQQSERFTQFEIDFRRDVSVLFEELLGVLAPLANTLSTITQPRAAFLYYVVEHAEVDEVAFSRDSRSVKNIEFGFAEGRRN